MKEVAFQPGRFQPVVEIAQRDSGVPAPADTDFSGLEEVALTTLEVAAASSRGFGSTISDPVPRSKLSQVIGYVLAARNIVEQLLVTGVHTRVTTPLRAATVSPLEPIVRAYNYFGHFEYESKLYVARGLSDLLVLYLFRLRQFATLEVAHGTKHTVTDPKLDWDDIDLGFYHLRSDGEIGFGKQKVLKDYLLDLVQYIHAFTGFTTDEKIVWLSYVLDVSNEASLTAFIRTAKSVTGFDPPPRTVNDEPSDKHKAAMKRLFGQEYSSAGDTIPTSRLNGSITNAYNTLRRVSQEYGYGMKTIPVPKYEGGSAAQLAYLIDDVLVSSVPLSLSDSTAATAFTTSYGVSRLYRSMPNLDRDQLLRELVAQSLLPVR